MRFCWGLLLFVAAYGAAALEFTEVWKKSGDAMWSFRAAELRAALPGVELQPVARRTRDLRGYWRDRSRSPLTFLEQRVGEVIFNFGDKGKLEGIDFVIYNRGDAGPMAGRDFSRLRFVFQNGIGPLLDVADPEKDSLRLGGVAHNARVWRGAAANARLRWCDTPGPDYLHLAWRDPKLEMEPLKAAFAGSATKSAAVEQVREVKGFKLLDVPMVNQGAKGYCAAATLARILQFYGSEADQNMLAVLARTEAGGTRLDDVLEAFDKVKSKCGLRIDEVYRCRDFANYTSCQDFISRYNNVARKMRKNRLNEDDFVRKSGNTKRISSGRIWKAALDQPDVYLALRLKDKRNYEKFREHIRENIEAGNPLIWAVPGHMRIINGVSEDGERLVFTDSWGKGHERKSVLMEQAWLITYAVWEVTPRRR